jgi:hypothetical protein
LKNLKKVKLSILLFDFNFFFSFFLLGFVNIKSHNDNNQCIGHYAFQLAEMLADPQEYPIENSNCEKVQQNHHIFFQKIFNKN